MSGGPTRRPGKAAAAVVPWVPGCRKLVPEHAGIMSDPACSGMTIGVAYA